MLKIAGIDTKNINRKNVTIDTHSMNSNDPKNTTLIMKVPKKKSNLTIE
jgi:hypothetical protein